MALGTFDGVHRGHLRVIDAARRAGLRTTVVTFDPHPRAVLGGRVELLATLERRLELLDEAGVEDVLVLRFDEQLAALTADEFAEGILRGIGAETVVAGETFRFGRGREGDLELLERLGFDVRRVPLVDNVSSSLIRELVHAGDPRARGDAARTASRGRGNRRPRRRTRPRARFPDREPRRSDRSSRATRRRVRRLGRGRRAAISIGTNPHFDGVERRVEAHLLDFDGDLYGERLVVEIWSPIREQRRFDSLEELVAAIGDDVDRTRAAVRPD